MLHQLRLACLGHLSFSSVFGFLEAASFVGKPGIGAYLSRSGLWGRWLKWTWLGVLGRVVGCQGPHTTDEKFLWTSKGSNQSSKKPLGTGAVGSQSEPQMALWATTIRWGAEDTKGPMGAVGRDRFFICKLLVADIMVLAWLSLQTAKKQVIDNERETDWSKIWPFWTAER